MDVAARCFAVLRELSADRTELTLAERATIEDAWPELARRYAALVAHRPFVRAARNGAHARWDEELHDHDDVAVLPPVRGGGPAARAATPHGRGRDPELLVRHGAGGGGRAV